MAVLQIPKKPNPLLLPQPAAKSTDYGARVTPPADANTGLQASTAPASTSPAPTASTPSRRSSLGQGWTVVSQLPGGPLAYNMETGAVMEPLDWQDRRQQMGIANPTFVPQEFIERWGARDAQGNAVQSNAQVSQLANSLNPTNGLADQYRDVQDSVYETYTRRLDPEWESQRRAFEQNMINRGLSSGSEAYRSALDNFDRGKNDAYGQAHRDALAQALGAQQQAWQQAEAERQRRDQTSALFSALAGASRAPGQDDNSWDRQFQERQFDEDTRRWNLTFGSDQDQTGMQNLLSALGLSFNTSQFNNGLLDADFNRGMGLLGMIPNSGPAGIDVLGPYQMQQQQAANQAQMNAQRSNGFWGGVGQLGGALIGGAATNGGWGFLMCDRNAKVTIDQVEPSDALRAVDSLPVDRWVYKGGDRVHVGTYADEFHEALGLPHEPHISVIDLMGALIGAVQCLSKEVKAMKELKNEPVPA